MLGVKADPIVVCMPDQLSDLRMSYTHECSQLRFASIQHCFQLIFHLGLAPFSPAIRSLKRKIHRVSHPHDLHRSSSFGCTATSFFSLAERGTNFSTGTMIRSNQLRTVSVRL